MAAKPIAHSFWTFAVLVAISLPVWAQQPPAYPNTDSASAAPQSQTDLQAVSATGLLPVYGIELRVENGWVDSQFPSQSSSFPNNGVSPSLQQAWDSLKASGFNMLRVPVDLRDTQASANRAANLCAWARNNNVKLLLVLTGATAQGSDYDARAATLVKTLVSNLRQSQAQDSYLQIAAYELDEELNHPGLHGQMPAAAMQQLVLKTAQSIRAAERQALEGTSTEATPLMVSASFDYELIQARAIAGVPLSEQAYAQAYSALTRFLQPLAASPDIDLISVTWSPGTISAGAVERPPVMLRSLTSDLHGKQIVFTTGFSTAFSSPEEQKHYYMLTFANLGDLRASGGADSTFMGVVFREALNGKSPQAPKGITERMAKWDWPSKADELAAMWNGKRKSDDMKWWSEKVQSSMGVMSLQHDVGGNPQVAPQPAQQALGQIATAVSDTNAAAGGVYTQYPGQNASAAYPTGTSTPGSGQGQRASGSQGGLDQVLQGKAQQGLATLLDGVFQRLGTAAAGNGGKGRGGAANPWGGYQATTCPPNSTDPSCTSAGQYPGYPGTDPGSAGYPSGQYPGTNPSNPAGGYPATGQYPGQPAGTGQYPAQYPSSNPPGPAAASAYPTAGMGGQPASLPPGSILLTKQNVTIQPASAQVGQPVNIVATLRNQAQSDATGLVLLASDQNNAVLAQMDSLNVPRGSTYPVTLQWVPADAQSALPITLHVSDATGNEIASASLDPISVAALPAGSGSGTGLGTSGGVTGGYAGDTGGATGGGAASKFFAPSGFARLGALTVQANRFVGEPVPIMATMSNPLGIPMRNIHATLLVDGVTMQSQNMSLLLPHQSRSLVFPAVIVKKPGTHEVKVIVQAQRGNAKPQTGYLVSKMVFVSAGSRPPTTAGVRTLGSSPGYHAGPTASPRVRSILAPPVMAAARPPAIVTPGPKPAGGPSGYGSTPPPSAATGVRPSLNARATVPAQQPSVSANNSTQPPASASPTRSMGTARASTATTTTAPAGAAKPTATPAYRPAIIPRPDVSVSASEISYGPAAPRPGQPVAFNVIVRNQGDVAAQRVSLVLKLYADGKLVAVTQPPIQFALGAKGAYRATWQAGMPAGRQIQLLASVAADGDATPANNQASIGVQSAGQAATRPRIVTNPGVKIQH